MELFYGTSIDDFFVGSEIGMFSKPVIQSQDLILFLSKLITDTYIFI